MAISFAARVAQFARLIPNGPAPVLPWELIEQQSPVAAQTEIDFTNLPAGFDRFAIEIDGIGVVADDVSVIMRVQSSGVWQTSGYTYAGVFWGTSSVSQFGNITESYSAGMPLHPVSFTGSRVGNSAGKGFSSRVEFNAKRADDRRRFRINSDYTRATDYADVGCSMTASYGAIAAITGVRLFTGSPQFKAQGLVKLFGLRN